MAVTFRPAIFGCACVTILMLALGSTSGSAQTGTTPAAQDTSSSSVKQASKQVGWVDDLTEVDFPQGKASGKLHGASFTLDRAELQQGILTLRQGSSFFADLEWKIFLFQNDVSRLEGHFLNIETEETEPVKNMPHVYWSWKQNSKDLPIQRSLTGGYIIKLKFGKVTNGKLPGQIYLCVPDFKRSFVAGTFEATVK